MIAITDFKKIHQTMPILTYYKYMITYENFFLIHYNNVEKHDWFIIILNYMIN